MIGLRRTVTFSILATGLQKLLDLFWNGILCHQSKPEVLQFPILKDHTPKLEDLSIHHKIQWSMATMVIWQEKWTSATPTSKLLHARKLLIGKLKPKGKIQQFFCENSQVFPQKTFYSKIFAS